MGQEDVLEKVQFENRRLYFVGDYNMNLLICYSHSLTTDFNDSMYSAGLFVCFFLVTRLTKVTKIHPQLLITYSLTKVLIMIDLYMGY